MNALDTVNMKGLKAIISGEREQAELEARKQGAWVRSRGTFLTTSNSRGQCEPRPAANCPVWNGTQKEIESLIALVLAEYPDVTEISIEGGYDCSDTHAGLYKYDDYEPMVSWWSFVVWSRS